MLDALTLSGLIAIGGIVVVFAFPEMAIAVFASAMVSLRERWRMHLVHKYGSQIAAAQYHKAAQTLKHQGWSKAKIDAAYELIHEQLVDDLGREHVDRTWPRSLLDHWLR